MIEYHLVIKVQVMKNIVKFIFCKFLYKVEYVNLENIQNIKNCIICPNHSNVFDPTFIYAQVDNLYIMAKSELFKNRLIRWLFTKYHIFPTNREKIDFKSLSHSLSIFDGDNNNKLLMFPEGRVIKVKNDIGKYYKKGAVYISATCKIPIIPVYITMRPKFFTKVKVIFGNPIYISKNEIINKKQIEEKSKQLIKEIYNLKERN